uniref:hypothetical protein n=1 Tax=Butyribacter intestini TaxID=1703332 RepID=UPI003AB24863
MTKTTKTIVTAIIVTTTLFSSCTPVSAREITSVNRTETGTLYGFSDGTGYYTDEIEGISTLDNLYPLTGIVTDIQSGENPEVDLVTITCSNGNMFSWYADAGDYEINDL